ncbi:MAG: hypothetical protein JO080_03750 [Mucilaginibacter sp.]|nr:hypothetical protein [Mucilaginibacter sp.]
MRLFFAVIILATTTLLANAQVTIKPGDKIIHYDWIKSSHDFYRNRIMDTTGKLTYDYIMEDFTVIDQVSKRITFARYRQAPAGSFSTDTSVTDLFLKPIRMHEVRYQRDVTIDMTFGDTQASVQTVKKGVSTVKNYAVKNGYFEDNMIEYIFGYLELKKRVTYTLDNFNAPIASDPFQIEYVFDDVWNIAPEHELYCTVLHFTHGGTSGYIWIDKSTHLMVKTLANFKNGSYVLTKI